MYGPRWRGCVSRRNKYDLRGTSLSVGNPVSLILNEKLIVFWVILYMIMFVYRFNDISYYLNAVLFGLYNLIEK